MAGNEDNTELTASSIALCVCSFLMMVFVCTGNLLTLVAVARTEILRTLANIYVSSLAMADLFVGITFAFTGVFMLPPIKVKYFDQDTHLCVFMQGASIGMIFASSYHMTLISFDRYIYITRPYLYPRLFTKNNILITLAVIWILSIIMVILPQFVSFDVKEVGECDLVRTLPLWYLFYIMTTTYAINTVTACVFYGQILMAAMKQRQAIQATTATIGQLNNNTPRKRVTKDTNTSKIGWKSIKFFFTIFGLFFICTTPCFLLITLDVYAAADEQLVRASTLLTMLNSGMNFVIYVVINKQFRRAFADILHCRPSSQ